MAYRVRALLSRVLVLIYCRLPKARVPTSRSVDYNYLSIGILDHSNEPVSRTVVPNHGRGLDAYRR